MASKLAIRGTRFWLGLEIRREWAKATELECEPLTFEDLNQEDRFIAMPLPGDNEGHDGLVGSYHLFEKRGLTNAVRLSDGVPVNFRYDFLVISVN